MNFYNQLSVYESEFQTDCMCSNAEEVSQFLSRRNGYSLSTVEFRAIDSFMKSVLPQSAFEKTEKRRFLLVSDNVKNMHEWDETQPIPDGWSALGVVYRNAYSEKPGMIAKFTLRSEEHPLNLNISRRSSTEALPIYIAEGLYSQYIESLGSTSVPAVDVGLTPFRSPMQWERNHEFSGYTMHIDDETFQLRNLDEITFCLETLLQHSLSTELQQLLKVLFYHLEHFPSHKVSSPMISFYTDSRKMVYVGGDGTNATRRLVYAGKIFPSYFSGTQGNVFLIRVGMFEPERINILVSRN